MVVMVVMRASVSVEGHGRRTALGAGQRDIVNVLGHGACSLVVLGVGDLEGVVRDKVGRVDDPANDGIDGSVV